MARVKKSTKQRHEAAATKKRGAKSKARTPKLRLASAETAGRIAALLAETWPDAVVELDHANAYQLLCATILAAQNTDKNINTLTPALFARYPDARALAAADREELERLVMRSGYYRVKAGYLIGMAQACVERHGGDIPRTMDELCALPGVARKTANVILGEAMGITAGICVDTHVARLSGRLALSANTDPVKIEQDLMKLVPQAGWTKFAQRLIWHGRRVCDAKKPNCDGCVLAPVCPRNGVGLGVGAGVGPRASDRGKTKQTPPRSNARGRT